MKLKKQMGSVLEGLLVVLGFSTAAVSCRDGGGGGGMMMYGTPRAEYSLKGRVVDASNPTKGIPGIRLIFGDIPIHVGNYSYSNSRDTVYTSQDGSYAYVSKYLRAFDPGDLPVLLEDVDGSANGSYQLKETRVVVDPNKDVKRVGDWTLRVTKTGVDFSMGKEAE